MFFIIWFILIRLRIISSFFCLSRASLLFLGRLLLVGFRRRPRLVSIGFEAPRSGSVVGIGRHSKCAINSS
eukprot:4302710-Amphidinium_carterae.1